MSELSFSLLTYFVLLLIGVWAFSLKSLRFVGLSFFYPYWSSFILFVTVMNRIHIRTFSIFNKVTFTFG